MVKINTLLKIFQLIENEKLGIGEYAPFVSSDAFFLFHRRCLRAGMYLKETTLSL